MSKKTILLALLVSLSIGILMWGFAGTIFNNLSNPTSSEITLNIWGFEEDEQVIKSVLPQYISTHPNIKVNFIKQTLINYQTRLEAQLQAGKGPDIFPIHSSWRGMLNGDLSSAPNDIMSIAEFNKNYYPVIKNALTSDNRIYGFPVELDGLVLFYNDEIVKGLSPNPPRTWIEFLDLSRKSTVKNQQGQFVTMGAAMGATNNIDYWPEIISILFLQQPNGNLADPSNQDGAEVLQFFTSFSVDPKNKTWDFALPNNQKLFAEGRLAFYFGTVKDIKKIKESNPGLNFKAVPVPQLSTKLASYGQFWALGVSSRSIHQKQAWELTKYLTSQKTLQDINNLRIQNGFYQRVYPFTEMSSLQTQDPLLSAFIQQGSIYQPWYLNSTILDGGINEEMVKVYKSAVDASLQGQDPRSSLQGIRPAIQEILAKYHSK